MSNETENSNSSQDALENLGKRSELNQKSTFDWDIIFRILGSITGIAGISTVLLFLFGFFNIAGISDSTNVPTSLYLNGSSEIVLLKGTTYFVSFIINIGIFLLIYLFSKSVINPLIRKIYGHIKYPILAWVLGIGLYTVIGVGGFSLPNLGVVNIINQVSFFILPALEILLIATENLSEEMRKKKNKSVYMKLNISDHKIYKISILTGGIIFLLFNQITIASNKGRALGCRTIAETPISVILFSSRPLSLAGEIKSNDNLYLYQGYYLIARVNDTYHLYREIDPQTLKPQSVFIINTGNFDAVELKSVDTPADWNLVSSCPET